MRRRPPRVDVKAPQYPRIFSTLLDPKPRFAGFGKSTALACTMYAGMLWGALSLPSTHAAQPKVEPELTVSLLELPKVAEPVAAAEPAAGPAGEAASSAVVQEVRKPRARPVAPPHPEHKPEQARPSEPIAKLPEPAPVSELKTEPKVVAPPTTPVVAAAAEPIKSAGPSSASGAGGGVGAGMGGGGSSTSKGTGAGGGTGGVNAGGGGLVVMPFGDGMTRPTLISKVDPTYTRDALNARVEGMFIAKCVITTAGELTRCRVVKPLPHMDQAVLSALSKWRYSPVLYQGKPTSVEYVISVRLVPP